MKKINKVAPFDKMVGSFSVMFEEETSCKACLYVDLYSKDKSSSTVEGV
jgi:hypothetical protein